ncbi:cystathionine gamma-synthase [Lentinus brumalis]|uniref:Cystathionine gamma-synthase n=1 Tax=Lentinus brumalis TaxID=2498619 RepID=A0A371CSV8_9APHY|nr:cystathionine gamma-synthase [Polyporus brumalis]
MAPQEKDTDSKNLLNGTDLIHADDSLHGPEVAPSLSVSTTFRAPNPLEGPARGLGESDMWNPARHVYSRYTQSVSTRAERVLSKITNGYAITFASGIAASHAVCAAHRSLPDRRDWNSTIEVYKRIRGEDLPIIGIDEQFQPGDLCWLETPLNPTGESRDIKYYADKVHAAGGYLIVNSTFAPPPLQYPFKCGADIVMHSGTKYFGGHSDLLCGVLVAPTLEKWNELAHMRTYSGSMMGSLEAWLLLRSLRTLHLRVPRQSENATGLAQWLSKAAGGGWNATFALYMAKEEYAARLPHLLQYFVPATSLGGVESLIEQRVLLEPGADPRLVRISVGVEDLETLKEDLRNAFQTIVKSPKAKL